MKYFFLIIFTFLIASCEMTDSVEQEIQETTISEILNDLALLKKFISVPDGAIEAKWQVVENKRRTGQLTALIKFQATDHIKSNSTHFEGQANRLTKAAFENWLPDSVKLDYTEQPPYVLLTKQIVQEPNLFVDTSLSPYVNGEILVLDNQYVLVMLYSM